MSQGECLIRPHQVMPCPTCHTLQEFQEHLYEAELPVTLECSRCPFKFALDHETKRGLTLPKRDPTLPVQYHWKINHTLPQAFAAMPGEKTPLEEQLDKLPPGLRTRSVHDRIDELGSMLLVAKRVQHSILADFRTVIDTFVEEVNSGISPYVYLRGAIDPEALREFFEAPFLAMPLTYPTKDLQIYARLIVAPCFYRRVHGIPVGNGLGFTMQLVCPYAELDDSTPDFLRKMLAMPDYPKLEILDRKVVGGHVNFHWRDLPGLEPDVDHSDSFPSVRMQEDTSLFRRWAVQHGVKPWKDILERIDAFYDARLDWVRIQWKHFHEPMRRLVQGGRLLYCHPDRQQRLRMMGAAIQSLQRWSIVIHDSGEKHDWADLGVLSGVQVGKSNVLFIPYQEFLSREYENQAELIICEADRPYSRAVLERLYQHTNRLLLLSGDPLFDTLEVNDYASLVYGLVNRAWFDREGFLRPRVWRKEAGQVNEKLIEALRKIGFVN